jgi:hypothetical protein
MELYVNSFSAIKRGRNALFSAGWHYLEFSGGQVPGYVLLMCRPCIEQVGVMKNGYCADN